MEKLAIAVPHAPNFIEELKTPKTIAMIDVLRSVNCDPQDILVVG
jgi:hypothetical protein